MNPLDQFLIAAARQMRAMPAALRADELRELRGHLEQRAEDYADQGMSDDDAQLRALEGLGSPRALGAGLCDAWENIEWSWWRLAAAVAGVTAFLAVGTIACAVALTLAAFTTEVALLPEIAPLLCAFYVALPLLCGVLFSHWLGRRGCLVATLYFLALALANLRLNFPQPSETYFRAMTGFGDVANAPWFPYLWVALAFIGAWVEQSWRLRKRRQMALAGERIMAPSRFLLVPLNLDWWRNAVLLTAFVSALYGARAWTTFHPQTPAATLRNYLITHGQMNFGDFETPRILALHELPAQSPAEIAGTQRRISFEIEERMTPQYQTRRVAFARRMLVRSEEQQEGEDETMRKTLARMERNRQITRGVALLTQSPGGWQVTLTGGSSPGAWAYDLYYQR